MELTEAKENENLTSEHDSTADVNPDTSKAVANLATSEADENQSRASGSYQGTQLTGMSRCSQRWECVPGSLTGATSEKGCSIDQASSDICLAQTLRDKEAIEEIMQV